MQEITQRQYMFGIKVESPRKAAFWGALALGLIAIPLFIRTSQAGATSFFALVVTAA
jgi:hypothetical protein